MLQSIFAALIWFIVVCLKKHIVGLAISQGNLGDSIRTKVKTDQNFFFATVLESLNDMVFFHKTWASLVFTRLMNYTLSNFRLLRQICESNCVLAISKFHEGEADSNFVKQIPYQEQTLAFCALSKFKKSE